VSKPNKKYSIATAVVAAPTTPKNNSDFTAGRISRGIPPLTLIVIKLKNLDAKAMEFESKTLKVEKVVAGSSEGTINVRAQKPGRYEFFDEYNEKVARGALVVK